MRRAIRWGLLTLGLAGVVTVVTVTPSAATPPSQLTNVVLAHGTDTSHGKVKIRFGTDVVMSQITVSPGGSSGWHSHPGGAIVIVKEGALTVYSPDHGRCRTHTYSAGDAFIERPGEVDDVLNNGSTPYVLYVTLPGVPPGGSARTDEPDPGTCPGI
jgi:quercetin dioxygenase-like cupin family protein